MSVAIDADVPLADVARALVSTYPRASSPTLSYELTPTGVLRDGQPIREYVADPLDLVPMFETDFYEQVVARASPGWLLHAAAIDVDGRALVLCGSSGAGKTTLALALAKRGLRLLTEEIVWMDAAGNVRGLPRAMHIASPDERRRIPQGWPAVAYPIRDLSGVVRDQLLVIPPAECFDHEERPLKAIVRMGHGPDWPVYLRDGQQPTALQRLWIRSLRQDDIGLETATTVLQRHGSFEMSSTTESEALQLLEPLLK